MLVSLALLSIITVATSSWVTTTAAGSRTVEARLQFDAAARATLERIFEDIATGDFDEQNSENRVVVEGNELRISTRSKNGSALGRSVVRIYHVANGALTVREDSAGMLRLVGGLANVIFALDEESDARSLQILMMSVEGRVIQRRIILP